ncbi:MAG: hypothetical protein HY885_03260 [Deltaproteobacteria bacterium]|nr:hypothetical protein [Deltaproteobacteria bacterium]
MGGKKNIFTANSICCVILLLQISRGNGGNQEGDYCREHDKKEDCLHFCHMGGGNFQQKNEGSI